MTARGKARAGSVLAGFCLALGAVVVVHAQPVPSLAQAVSDAAARNSPVWISYRVPMIDGTRTLCFDAMTWRHDDRDDLRLATPSPSELVVFARINGSRVERIWAFTPECPVDAGSTPVIRIAGVAAAESIAWLGSVVEARAVDRKRPEGGSMPSEAGGGRQAVPNDRVIEPALLALSLHEDPAAQTKLVAIARDNASAHVRGQALFWLAQRAGERAVAAIAGAIDNDPETEVKKKAVFALSQLPKDEGVPKLIEVARTNRNAAVRKQAMFWLGQSNDPRAIGFFEEILSKK